MLAKRILIIILNIYFEYYSSCSLIIYIIMHSQLPLLLSQTLHPLTVHQAELQLSQLTAISPQLFLLADDPHLDLNIRLAAVLQLKYQRDKEVIKGTLFDAMTR